MNVKGVLTTKLKKETGTSKAGKEWEKQTIVIDNGDQYNPLLAISFFGEKKIELLKGLKKGDTVEVSINLSSHEFNGKYFHNVDGWAVEKLANDGAESTGNTEGDDVDDLPF